MPVTLHTVAAQALAQTAGVANLNTLGVQVGTIEGGTANIYRYGVQALATRRADTRVHHMGVQVAFRGSRVNVTGQPSDSDGVLAPVASLGNVEEEDVIYNDIIFPECISYGSTGVPRYLTDKSEVLSGDEQRQTRYKYPRHEYSINMENVPAPEIAEIMNIWHVCSGDYAAFLFLDPLDHTSGNTDTNFSPTEITPFDQELDFAVGSETDYVLYKTYTHKGRQKRRRIKYPKLDTLRVAIDGTEIFNWEFDYDKGVLRLASTISAGTSFAVIKSGNTLQNGGGHFSDLSVGDLFFIDGFTNPAINVPSGNPLRVVAVTDSNNITVETYAGGDWAAGEDETANVTLNPSNAPTGSGITAGFKFYVPVRFDDGDNATSEIMAGLRETAVANFGDIKLREVFE